MLLCIKSTKKINKYMLTNDSQMLEEAYLSISKKTQNPEQMSDDVSTNPNSVVDVGPMEEPAPGVSMNLSDTDEVPNAIDKDTTGVPVSMDSANSSESCGCGNVPCSCNTDVNLEQEEEEDQMTIDNLNSIRESVMKIATCCASGKHLEIWAQQKLAIAMDNLAEVARRLH